MSNNDESGGGALEAVARIHPALERLRRLVASAMLLDMKATTEGYWAHGPDGAGDRGLRPAETA